MKITVKTTGFRELEDTLRQFNKATARNVLSRAALKAMTPVADAMRDKAPKDDGELKDAIKAGTGRAKGKPRHFRDTSIVEAYAGVAVVGGGMPPQGTQQEFGNENHGPQPFARPGWDAEARPTLDRVKVELKAEIDKAAARAARRAAKAGR